MAVRIENPILYRYANLVFGTRADWRAHYNHAMFKHLYL